MSLPPGTKLDRGKARAGLMMRDFSRALAAVADVTTFGAEKYSPSGWTEVPDREARYADALARHLLASEEDDPESGLPHAAHVAWNALALLEIKLRSGR